MFVEEPTRGCCSIRRRGVRTRTGAPGWPRPPLAQAAAARRLRRRLVLVPSYRRPPTEQADLGGAECGCGIGSPSTGRSPRTSSRRGSAASQASTLHFPPVQEIISSARPIFQAGSSTPPVRSGVLEGWRTSSRSPTTSRPHARKHPAGTPARRITRQRGLGLLDCPELGAALVRSHGEAAASARAGPCRPCLHPRCRDRLVDGEAWRAAAGKGQKHRSAGEVAGHVGSVVIR
jgi:hypothetical protein